jgi:hypothetical protein
MAGSHPSRYCCTDSEGPDQLCRTAEEGEADPHQVMAHIYLESMLDARTVMLISNLIFEDGDKYWMYAFPSFRTAMCTLIIVLKLVLLNRRIMVSGRG